MNANTARRVLVAQHDRIRGHLVTCAALAGRHRDREQVHLALDEALAQLRHAFTEHNAVETDLIRGLLRDARHWGTVLIDRMLEEHVAEHTAFWELLTGSVDTVAAHIDELVDELDAHMAAEERTFLSPLVLRDEVIERHQQEADQK
jgi:hypothetical protein